MACKNLKIGMKVRVNFPGIYHGKVYTTSLEYNSNPHGWYVSGEGIAVNSVLFYDTQLEPVEMNREFINKCIDDIKAEQERLNKKIDVHSQQLAYLDETGQESFDEIEFKTYYALKVLEQDNMTTVQRAKAIANLVNMAR